MAQAFPRQLTLEQSRSVRPARPEPRSWRWRTAWPRCSRSAPRASRPRRRSRAATIPVWAQKAETADPVILAGGPPRPLAGTPPTGAGTMRAPRLRTGTTPTSQPRSCAARAAGAPSAATPMGARPAGKADLVILGTRASAGKLLLGTTPTSQPRTCAARAAAVLFRRRRHRHLRQPHRLRRHRRLRRRRQTRAAQPRICPQCPVLTRVRQ